MCELLGLSAAMCVHYLLQLVQQPIGQGICRRTPETANHVPALDGSSQPLTHRQLLDRLPQHRINIRVDLICELRCGVFQKPLCYRRRDTTLSQQGGKGLPQVTEL